MKNFIKSSLIICLVIFISTCSKDSNEQTEPNSGVQVEPNLNSGDNIEEISKTNSESVSKLNELLVDNDLLNSLEKLKVWLESSPNIFEADITDGDVEIVYNSGLSSFIIISVVDEEGNRTKGSVNTPKTSYKNSAIRVTNKKTNQVSFSSNMELLGGGDVLVTDKDVLIYDAFQFYFSTGEGQKIEELFESSSLNFNVNYLKDEECTLNSLNKLTDYGFIYFSTHGTNGDIIWTREKVEALDVNRWSLYVTQKLKIGTFVEFEYTNEEGRKVEDAGDYWGVTSSYIRDLNGEFPNSIIFNSSCESTKTNKLYEAFKTKKAKTYLGFDKTVMSDFSKYVGVQFTNGLLNPSSNAEDAFNGIVTKRDPRVRIPFPLETDATIEIFGEMNITFHAVDSIPIYEAAVLGQWKTYSGDGSDGLGYILEVRENGTGQYILDASGNDLTPWNYYMSWEIQRGDDGRYYFWDYGFWHGAFTYLKRDPLKYPLGTHYKYASDNGENEYIASYYTKL